MKAKRLNRAAKLAQATDLITQDNYDVDGAAELLPKLSISSFTGSAVLDVKLNLKEKQANESIRGSMVFPHQFGEEKKVLVLAEGEKVTEAEKAGADYAGLDELVTKIDGGWFDFDVVIATPSVMPKIARLGKVLGPKQIMPNPKTGTVTDNVEAAIKTYKAGKVDFKMDPGKTIKVKFATLDMKPAEIAANLNAAIEAINGEVKRFGSNPIAKMTVSPTMGPSITLSV